jgi:hypothetical protein
MGIESGKKHVLGYNKIIQNFVQGQWVSVKLEGIYNGQILGNKYPTFCKLATECCEDADC